MFTAYVIEDHESEGWYYNFEYSEFSHNINPNCFLPSLWLAKDFIEDHLSCDDVIYEVKVYSINDDEEMHYSMKKIYP